MHCVPPDPCTETIQTERTVSRKNRFVRATCAVAVLAILSLAACDDPGSVGSDLLGDENAEPIRVRLLPTDIQSETIDKSTGAVRGELAFSGMVSTFLAGEVRDPILGSRESVGYVDFRISGFPEGFADDSVKFVSLQLDMPYVYGDTTAENEMALYEVAEAWDPTVLDASARIPTGEEITRITYRPSDTMIVVSLPADWIRRKNDVLVSNNFNGEFHGFELRPVNTTAVVGFSMSTSLMIVGNDVDTLGYAPERLFTHLRESEPIDPPTGLIPIIDGFGRALTMDFDLTLDEYDTATLSRVSLRVPTERDMLKPDSLSGFVRPPLQQLLLYAIDPSGERTLLGSTFPDDEGRFTFVGATASTEESVLGRFQSELLGASNIDHFLVSPPPTLMSIAPLLVPYVGADNVPEIIMTLVPA